MDTNAQKVLTPGDVLFLEREVPGIPWPTGMFVLVRINEALAVLSLASRDANGLYAIDNSHTISVEDLAAFSATGERARISR